jgi:hypothetical protein
MGQSASTGDIRRIWFLRLSTSPAVTDMWDVARFRAIKEQTSTAEASLAHLDCTGRPSTGIKLWLSFLLLKVLIFNCVICNSIQHPWDGHWKASSRKSLIYCKLKAWASNQAADRRPESKSVVRPCAASSRSAARRTAALASGRSSTGMIVMVLRMPASS